MDKITRLIKSEIKKQYKNMRRFSESSGIPYSTLSNALAKGIGGTSYDTVIKICKLLNIKQTDELELAVVNEHFPEIHEILNALDEQALHTVKTILRIEHERCTRSQIKEYKTPVLLKRERNVAEN